MDKAISNQQLGINEKSSYNNVKDMNDIFALNPWVDVANKYKESDFLFSRNEQFICEADKKIIEDFNKTVDEEYQYILNVPAYPWYGNPLKANVIILSLNPGYVEKEITISKFLQKLPLEFTEGFIDHLRKMLTFEVDGFLPMKLGKNGIFFRDLANILQSWYWEDRFIKEFNNNETELTYEEINSKFSVIQFIGYSSKKYKAFKKNQLLPSQEYTKNLIHQIVKHNKNAIFIIARHKKIWKNFCGKLWEDNSNRFIETHDYLGQRFTKEILGQESYSKIVDALKS